MNSDNEQWQQQLSLYGISTEWKGRRVTRKCIHLFQAVYNKDGWCHLARQHLDNMPRACRQVRRGNALFLAVVRVPGWDLPGMNSGLARSRLQKPHELSSVTWKMRRAADTLLPLWCHSWPTTQNLVGASSSLNQTDTPMYSIFSLTPIYEA